MTSNYTKYKFYIIEGTEKGYYWAIFLNTALSYDDLYDLRFFIWVLHLSFLIHLFSFYIFKYKLSGWWIVRFLFFCLKNFFDLILLSVFQISNTNSHIDELFILPTSVWISNIIFINVWLYVSVPSVEFSNAACSIDELFVLTFSIWIMFFPYLIRFSFTNHFCLSSDSRFLILFFSIESYQTNICTFQLILFENNKTDGIWFSCTLSVHDINFHLKNILYNSHYFIRRSFWSTL